MKIQYLVLSLLVSMAIFSCKSENDDREELFKEVMAIHDEVMPKTAHINKLSRQIKAIIPELQEPYLSQAQTQILALDKADDAMMDWMEAFNPPNTPSKAMVYLESEKAKISEVRELMIKSLSDGQYFIKSLSPENN